MSPESTIEKFRSVAALSLAGSRRVVDSNERFLIWSDGARSLDFDVNPHPNSDS